MSRLHVLVIDDELALRQILSAAVSEAGYSVDQAATVAEATAKLGGGDFDVALCDIMMPDGNGIDLLRATRSAGIETAFIMITGFASLETAVDALRAGASDYITKPVQSEEVAHRLAQIQALSGLREENESLRKSANEYAPKLFRFTSDCMLETERMATKVAQTDSTVLITGESGTGKGVLARMIHDLSDRSAGPFLIVNCSAIPEHLLESEFFGHTKGAFTGAAQARKGLFLQADGGSLFLDEISELPLPMQTKLLHMVENKEIRPLGSERARRVNTRIVAATNADLDQRVAEGRFRGDLYFRLSMFNISMPPLRERKEDLPRLIRFLLARANLGAADARIDPLAEEILLNYDWPGNVRELENAINRACILAEDNCVCVGDLPASLTASAARSVASGTTNRCANLREQMRKLEADILLRAIEETGGDRKLAAQNLGIGLSSLYRKLDELQSSKSEAIRESAGEGSG